ncbi:hypothetical protein FRC06_004493 [Ceratobasidium sp. 370]|nr:hypothetical protein FRC06_004493 [Ceratobasidium sp. 370]
MPRVQSAGSASTSAPAAGTPHALKRNQASAILVTSGMDSPEPANVFPGLPPMSKANAQKPCATCAKSHRLAVAANPTLAGTEPECTFDEFTPDNPPPAPEGPRAKYQRLENRINELEALLKEQAAKETNISAPILPTPVSAHASPQSSYLMPDTGVEKLNSDLSGFIRTSPRSASSPAASKEASNPFLPTSPPEAYTSSNSPSNSSNAGQLIFGDWPRRLPQPELLHHLIDVFFNCYPHAHYLLHRPTFMASLTFSPKSPAFPHASLLHSICAYASVFSPRVETPPADIRGGVFPDGNSKVEDSFAEKHVRWSRQARDEATSVGASLIECTQCK